ncbi:MAG: class II fructose-bisphosphate aldolase [Alphaproteobacteria bacterium]
MTAATLNDVLLPAARNGYAIAGLVVLGWEDARAYTEAAEACNIPIILQAGPGCRKHTPVEVLGPMFRHLADHADVPVVCHIDHAKTAEECRAGIDHGFTSLMYDGSALPLAENIDTTATIAEFAHRAGVSVEGEIGFVGYAAGAASQSTAPDEAARFDRQSGADAIAISVGNVHLQTDQRASIDRAALAAIEAVTTRPLVLHGASGIPSDMRRALARETRVAKFNIGTELRMAFGTALRRSLADQPEVFDRVALLQPTIAALQAPTMKILRSLRYPEAAE